MNAVPASEMLQEWELPRLRSPQEGTNSTAQLEVWVGCKINTWRRMQKVNGEEKTNYAVTTYPLKEGLWKGKNDAITELKIVS